MNRIHRKVWNAHRGAFVAVAEIARSRGKGGSKGSVVAALSGALLALPGTLALAGPDATTLPGGGQVAAGAATITRSGAAMTVQQASDRAAINWQTFSIGSGASVQFVQPTSSSVTLNRVVGGEGSVIDGALRANGQVFLVNPNGVLFGRGAQVDTAGLVASTRALTDTDFMAGKASFAGSSRAGVVNQGSLNAADGGYVALLGQQVRNDGVITARLGTVALASGDRLSLNFDGHALVGVVIEQGTLDALVANGGVIRADGGLVSLSAKTASALLDAVVNNSGEIRAQTVAEGAGRILLLGDMEHGRVEVAGTFDASASGQGVGGFVETSAAKVQVADGARVDTRAAHGASGTWLIDPTDFVIAASGGDITGATVAANLATGDVSIQSTSGTGGTDGKVIVNDPVAWSANRLTLTALGNIEINANLTGSGTARLSLLYGQGAVAAGNTSTYTVATGAKVDLPAGPNLTLKQGSDGTPDIYTVITALGSAGSTAATDLQGLGNAANLSGLYALGADVDASATAGWNTAGAAHLGFAPIGQASTPFTGRLEGLGHTVTGLYINRVANDAVGLFGAVGAAGSVFDLNLANVNIAGATNVGILVGTLDGAVRNVSVSGGGVAGNTWVGGIAGSITANGSLADASTSTTQALSVRANVSTAGGLVGANAGAILRAVSGAATSVVSRGDTAGGLVGATDAALSDLTSNASVIVNTGVAAGGFVGHAGAAITNATATGNVSGRDHTGGLVGEATAAATITTSTASGNVTGRNQTGGLVGYTDAPVHGSSASGNVTASGASVDLGGLVGATTADVLSSTASGRVDGRSYGLSDNVGGLIGNLGGLPGSPGGFVSLSTTTTPNGATGNRVLGGDNVGGLVGLQTDGQIGGVSAAVNVLGNNYVGGLIGYTLRASGGHASGNVTGNDHVGGLAGISDSLTDSYATGQVVGNTIVGGLVGEVAAGTISGSYATGNVNASGNTTASVVGGLVGLNSGVLKHINMLDPSNGGTPIVQSVYGATRVGGLVGENRGSVLPAASYSNVWGSGDTVGGAIGLNTASGSFLGTPVSGSVHGGSKVGGAVGENAGSFGGITASGAVDGSSSVGGLVGLNTASITNSSATGSVSASGSDAGGAVGQNSGGTLNGVTASGTVGGNGDNHGGLVGNNTGTVSNSGATGNVGGSGTNRGGAVGLNSGALDHVTATGNLTGGGNVVGGLVGRNDTGGVITDSSATGNLTSSSDSVGGLVGASLGSVADSYATGDVDVSGAHAGIGGLVGQLMSGAGLTSVYATGHVIAVGSTGVGGLVGVGASGSTVGSGTASGQVRGAQSVGGLIGSLAGALTGSSASGAVVLSGTDVGGLVGQLDGTLGGASIASSTTSASVQGMTNVGGLVGHTLGTASVTGVAGTVTSSGAVGGVTAVGGSIGLAGAGAVFSQVSASGAVSGQTAVAASSARTTRH